MRSCNHVPINELTQHIHHPNINQLGHLTGAARKPCQTYPVVGGVKKKKTPSTPHEAMETSTAHGSASRKLWILILGSNWRNSYTDIYSRYLGYLSLASLHPSELQEWQATEDPERCCLPFSPFTIAAGALKAAVGIARFNLHQLWSTTQWIDGNGVTSFVGSALNTKFQGVCKKKGVELQP